MEGIPPRAGIYISSRRSQLSIKTADNGILCFLAICLSHSSFFPQQKVTEPYNKFNRNKKRERERFMQTCGPSIEARARYICMRSTPPMIWPRMHTHGTHAWGRTCMCALIDYLSFEVFQHSN